MSLSNGDIKVFLRTFNKLLYIRLKSLYMSWFSPFYLKGRTCIVSNDQMVLVQALNLPGFWYLNLDPIPCNGLFTCLMV